MTQYPNKSQLYRSHLLMAYNLPYLVLPIRNLHYTLYSHVITCMAQTSISGITGRSFKIYTHLQVPRSILFTICSIIHYLHVSCQHLFRYHEHFLLQANCILAWLLVSHHPDGVIITSPSTPPDSNIEDDFCQPLEEKILQCIENIKHTHTRHTRSISALW